MPDRDERSIDAHLLHLRMSMPFRGFQSFPGRHACPAGLQECLVAKASSVPGTECWTAGGHHDPISNHPVPGAFPIDAIFKALGLRPGQGGRRPRPACLTEARACGSASPADVAGVFGRQIKNGSCFMLYWEKCTHLTSCKVQSSEGQPVKSGTGTKTLGPAWRTMVRSKRRSNHFNHRLANLASFSLFWPKETVVFSPS